MNRTCPCCGQMLPEADRGPVAELRAWCAENGHPVYALDRVSEATAAAILGREPGTLRNWRAQGAPLAYVRIRGRVSYRLEDLAAAMEAETFTNCNDM